MSKEIDMEGHVEDAHHSPPHSSIGPDLSFAPRPYPRRAPGESILRGRRVLVIDGDVQRGRRTCAMLAERSAAGRHHAGDETLGALLAGPDRYEAILVRAEDADDEDVLALANVDGRPAVVLIGDTARAEALGVTATTAAPSDADLVVATARALERHSLARENESLREQLDERYSFGSIKTRDTKLKQALRILESVADTRATVLLLGETGTGKSLMARTLHQTSSRRAGPFVEVNCGALPAGLLESELFGHAKGAFTGAAQDRAGRFEAADGGTIFLDEVDSAPLELQVKLLRAVQDRAFERVGESKTRTSDVRIVAATNADLEAKVEAGEFREDLLWRLRVVEVALPPLRERPGDLASLASGFVNRFAAEYHKPIRGISPAALRVLASARFPGNVRQLEHSLERAVILSGDGDPGGARGLLDVSNLGQDLLQEAASSTSNAPAGSIPAGLEWLSDLTRAIPLRVALEGPEKLLIERSLARNEGRRDRAAAELGINRSTLFNKMRKYRLLDVNFSSQRA